jgi:hypothetical protein
MSALRLTPNTANAGRQGSPENPLRIKPRYYDRSGMRYHVYYWSEIGNRTGYIGRYLNTRNITSVFCFITNTLLVHKFSALLFSNKQILYYSGVRY